MRYWDSSALVPGVTPEAASRWARSLLRSDAEGVVWATTPVEVHSALARRLRQGALSMEEFRKACRGTEILLASFSQVTLLEPVCERAVRILDVHPLGAAHALQLAAAIVASKERPRSLPFVTLDRRLAEAAEREGFPLITVES